jgi:hypothetical protein
MLNMCDLVPDFLPREKFYTGGEGQSNMLKRRASVAFRVVASKLSIGNLGADHFVSWGGGETELKGPDLGKRFALADGNRHGGLS